MLTPRMPGVPYSRPRYFLLAKSLADGRGMVRTGLGRMARVARLRRTVDPSARPRPRG